MKSNTYTPEIPKKRYPNYDTNKIERGQIPASSIVKWCLENGDAYPLPSDYQADRVFIDIAECAWFETPHWTTVSKGTYAKLYSCAQSQVSRWLKAGMPQRDDGRLNYWEAERWLEKYDDDKETRKASGWK
jgi:hypothetical protein